MDKFYFKKKKKNQRKLKAVKSIKKFSILISPKSLHANAKKLIQGELSQQNQV